MLASVRWAVDENRELDDAVILAPWIGYGAAFGDLYDDRSRPRRGHGARPHPAVSARWAAASPQDLGEPHPLPRPRRRPV